MTLIVLPALFLAVLSLLVIGGVFFALFLFFPLFLLALVGVLAGTGDRSVRQHRPPMDPKGWRKAP